MAYTPETDPRTLELMEIGKTAFYDSLEESSAANKAEAEERQAAAQYGKEGEEDKSLFQMINEAIAEALAERWAEEAQEKDDLLQAAIAQRQALRDQGLNRDEINQVIEAIRSEEEGQDVKIAWDGIDALNERMEKERAQVNTADVGMMGEDLDKQWKAEEAATQAADRAGLDIEDEAARAVVEDTAQAEADKAAEELAAEEEHHLAGKVDISDLDLSHCVYDPNAPEQDQAQAAGPQLVTTPPAPAPEQPAQGQQEPQTELSSAITNLVAGIQAADELAQTGVTVDDVAIEKEPTGGRGLPGAA